MTEPTADLVGELAEALGPDATLIHFPRAHRPSGLPLPYVGDPGDPQAYLRSAEIDRTEADTYDRDDPRRDECLARVVAWERMAADAEAAMPAPELTADEAATVARFDAAPDGLDADEPDRPAETPLPVLLDALAAATAQASAVKTVVDVLRPEVERRAIARHAEEGTDRYRRDAALITVRFSADEVISTDRAALGDLLRSLGTAEEEFIDREVKLNADPATIERLLDVLGKAIEEAHYEEPDRSVGITGGWSPVELDIEEASELLRAVEVRRTLNPTAALIALTRDHGMTVTKAGAVVADTGELVECISVRRGIPTGVQVRCDPELKAAHLADAEARLLP